MTTIKSKPTSTTTIRIIVSSVGIAVILGLSALLVLPSLQNQAFADSEVSGSTRTGMLTCPDGRELRVDSLIFLATEQGGEWSGSLQILELGNADIILVGQFDKGTVTPSGNFNLRGTVTHDFRCGGSSTPYNMHVAGECGENVEIKFRTEDGEQATLSAGGVRCSTS
jgi:hypothetical protein